MRYLIVLMTVVAWFGVMTAATQACSCAGQAAPCEGYGSASAVFAGTVIGTRQLEKPKPEDRDKWYWSRVFKFSVEQSFLGDTGTEVEVFTGNGGGDCGYGFRIGERYLVYAYRSQNRLVTTICSRTRPFANANEDLAFLGNLSSAAPGATIHGQIVRDPSMQTDMESIVSAALIRIEGSDVRREIRPDADGRYRVTGLPPGRYKVTLQLPETLFTDRTQQETIVADRGCAVVWYRVTDNGRLTGRVLDPQGQPVPRILITLFDPATDPKKDYVKTERTDSEGRFNFSDVPAGRYLIGVNNHRFRNPTDSMEAYPPAFYPGVLDQANAEVITLGAGEKLTGLDIRVPLPRAPSVVTVRVVWADGSPVSKASLTLRDATGEPDVAFAAQADEHGRFTINGYVGQQLIVEARSNRPYVALGDRFEPMERCEKVQVTLEKARESIKVVITKIR
jgi:5-hydroxyisourate hydrolase-like protein (transthyretin family)